MSTQPRLQPTRRTVLRSAAWSTAAVTVVVATPNIAAASPGSVVAPKATLTFGTPVKYSDKDTKFVAWDIGVRADNMDLTDLVLQLKYYQNGGGATATLDKVVVQYFPAAGPWGATVTKSTMTLTDQATATATATTGITKGDTANIHVQFQGSDNSSGQVSVTVMAKDSAGNLAAVGGKQAVIWDSGKEHKH